MLKMSKLRLLEPKWRNSHTGNGKSLVLACCCYQVDFRGNLDHLGCQKQQNFSPFLSLFRLVVARQMCQKASKMGHFGTKNGSKWVKNVCFENDPRPRGMLKQVKRAHLYLGTSPGLAGLKRR